MLVVLAAAAAPKVAVVAPAATRTDGGRVRKGLLLASVTLAPPAGAFSARVTEQAATALGPRVAGLQATAETRTGANRMAAVWELAPSVAVTVAL